MPGKYLLAYDVACGPCSRFKTVVDFLDARGLIEFVSLRQADEAGELDGVAPSLRYDSFHLMAPGRAVLSGADALLPLFGLLLTGREAISRVLEAIPGCARAISFGYSTVSRLHHVGACATTAAR